MSFSWVMGIFSYEDMINSIKLVSRSQNFFELNSKTNFGSLGCSLKPLCAMLSNKLVSVNSQLTKDINDLVK